MPIEVKICGLSDGESVDAAVEAGADFVGFVFFPPSPRNVSPEAAAPLMRRARGKARIVALLVDPEPGLVDEVARRLAPDLIQLHGRETPERVARIGAETGIPVMKAVGVSEAADLAGLSAFPAADRLLLDAKPPRAATRPGGNGTAFDWTLLRGFRDSRPWLLSGGLDAGNVARALTISGAGGIDVSSGVERAPGRKDPELIRRFIAEVRNFEAGRQRLAG